MIDTAQQQILDILQEVKNLAVKYYNLTGKPLGATGEIAELEAANKLGLRLLPARERGVDAIGENGVRIQIKGRAVASKNKYRGRCPSIKCEGLFDRVLLVLLDKETLDAVEIWEATESDILSRLSAPGSKARNERNSLGISQYRSIARRVWPHSDTYSSR